MIINIIITIVSYNYNNSNNNYYCYYYLNLELPYSSKTHSDPYKIKVNKNTKIDLTPQWKKKRGLITLKMISHYIHYECDNEYKQH